jgi:WD40 repeat protein
MSFQNKYLKYKNKYLDLKKQIGGTYRQLPGYERPDEQSCTLCTETLNDAEEEDYYKCRTCNQCMHILCYNNLPVGNIYRTICPACAEQNWVDLPFPPNPQPPLQVPPPFLRQTLGVRNNNDPALGHTRVVSSVALNGDRIVSGSWDHTIKIWGPNDTCLQTLGVDRNNDPALGHTHYVNSVAVLGDRIISGSNDYTIKIWAPNDAGIYTCLQTLGINNNSNPASGHTNIVKAVAVLGDCIISGSNDYTIKIWAPNDAGVYTCLQTLGVNRNENPVLGHTDYVKSLAVIGYRIISGSSDTTIKIWSPNVHGIYTCTHTLGVANNNDPVLGHTNMVRSVAHLVTQDGNGVRIISGSGDNTIKIWAPNDAGVYTCTQTLGVGPNNDPALGHTAWVESVALDGDRIISGSYDTTIKIWTRNQQGQYTCTHTFHGGEVNMMSVVVDDDHRIITGCSDYTIKIWDTPQ